MKLKKVLSVISFSILMLFILSGCVPKEGQMLLDAISKQSEIKSYEQKVEMTLNIDAPRNSYDEFAYSLINNAILTVDSKQDLVNAKQFFNTTIDFGGVIVNVPAYNDSQKMLVKMPFERSYIEASSEELAKIKSGLSNTPATAITPKKQKELQQKMQILTNNFITAYAVEHPETFKNISSKGIQTISTPEGSKQVSVIQIKFNDNDFKTFVLSTLDDVSKSGSFKEFSKSMVEFLPEVIESLGLNNNSEVESLVDQLKATQNNFDGNYDIAMAALKEYFPQLKNDINKYFEIGSNGLVLTYYIDNNGYITRTNAVIDCILKQPSYNDETAVNKVGFTLKVDSLLYNINNTIVESLTTMGEKTIPVKKYIKNSPIWKDSPIADALGISPIDASIYLEDNYGYINGKYYSFNTPPYLSNDNLMVPASFIKKALRLELTTDDSKGTITLSDASKKVTLSKFSQKAIVNDNPKVLPIAPEVVNGEYMIPLRFITNQFGAEVGWDSNEYEDYMGTKHQETTIAITKN